ncbi:MAG TPA: hypothetical protein PK022_05625 [Syntrophales bacterium]|nr:hypothetical protein [Syntrophales bacterium]
MSIYDDRDIPDQEEKSDDKVVVEARIKPETDIVRGKLLFDGCGKVVSIGTGVLTVKPGDEVFFDQAAGEDILLFGKILKILKESEVTLTATMDN